VVDSASLVGVRLASLIEVIWTLLVAADLASPVADNLDLL